MQAALLGELHAELPAGDSSLFASVAQRLAFDFGAVTATAVEALRGGDGHVAPSQSETGAGTSLRADPEQASPAELHRPGAMRHRLDQLVETHKRYGHPFGLAVFDAEGPGTRKEGRDAAPDTIQAVLGAALHDSVRLVDETYPLGDGALCVLAPNQNTVGGVLMAERLLKMLGELEAAGGLRIGVTAGVVACPEHGSGAEALLHKADEAMWRARSVGQPVGVGALNG